MANWSFKRIRDDLQSAGGGYILLALSPQLAGRDADSLRPTDFIVKGEEYGLPQKRHRVISVGIRRGSADRQAIQELGPLLLPSAAQLNVQDVLDEMPRLRCGLSQKDSFESWTEAMCEAAKAVNEAVSSFLLTNDRNSENA